MNISRFVSKDVLYAFVPVKISADQRSDNKRYMRVRAPCVQKRRTFDLIPRPAILIPDSVHFN